MSDVKEYLAKMKPQKDEFDALYELIKSYNNLPAIVDDDYPAMRHEYEGSLRVFIEALKANGRLQPMQKVTKVGDLNTSAKIQECFDEIDLELVKAMTAWPPFNSMHEGYGVLLEEVDELWDHVKTKQKNRQLAAARKEALQVAAMAIRFALEVCDEERGRK